MQLRVFSLGFDSERGGFDDSEVRDFLANKRVLEVREHFFVHEERPQLMLLALYRSRDAVLARSGKPERRKAADWRGTVPECERPLYDAIRHWRNDKAKAEGKPAYALLTNKQVAEVVVAKPRTLEALSDIDGVGEARLKAWGAELLAVVAASVEASDA